MLIPSLKCLFRTLTISLFFYSKCTLLDCLMEASYRQFHQHFTYEFFIQTSFFYVHVTREKLPKWDSYKKRTHIMLMKLTPTLLYSFLSYIDANRQRKYFSCIVGFKFFFWASLSVCHRRLVRIREARIHFENKVC